MGEYTPNDVKKITGAETRRLQQLVEVGLVTAESRGQGVQRLFYPKHIFEVFLVELLASRGVRLSRIKKIFEMARKEYPETFDLKNYAEDEKNVNSVTRVLTVYSDRVFFGQMATGKDVKGQALVKMNGFDAAVIVNLSELYNKVKTL